MDYERERYFLVKEPEDVAALNECLDTLESKGRTYSVDYEENDNGAYLFTVSFER